MKVKPAIEGAIIRDPITKQPLPAQGREVPDNSFWRRRLADGEVVLVDTRVSKPVGNEPIAPLTTRKG